MVNAKINGIEIQVEKGTTILDAAREKGIRIPTLCYLKEINEIGACRVCLVEIGGKKNLVAACNNVVILRNVSNVCAVCRSATRSRPWACGTLSIQANVPV